MVSRLGVVWGKSKYYSTELVGTYWHSPRKETGKCCGQGFTSGPPDTSFVVTEVLLLVHHPQSWDLS